MKKTSRRAGLALALGLCLSLAAPGVSTAAPETVPTQHASLSAADAAACPAQGQRYKTSATADKVFLVGPGNEIFWIPNQTVYRNLWADDSGIGTAHWSCAESWTQMDNAELVKSSSSGAVYIWDRWEYAMGGYGSWRRIANWTATFINKYHFDPSKIRTVPAAQLIYIGSDWT
ncbi:hypothetical protein OHB06_00870 [Streptomyces sp. NBC_01604]|uniref:hypothetical protein n=1 Tax=Streptomyces sp. NBC_01604 TaxID=2975894 RepID=UPI003867DFF0